MDSVDESSQNARDSSDQHSPHKYKNKEHRQVSQREISAIGERFVRESHDKACHHPGANHGNETTSSLSESSNLHCGNHVWN